MHSTFSLSHPLFEALNLEFSLPSLLIVALYNSIVSQVSIRQIDNLSNTPKLKVEEYRNNLYKKFKRLSETSRS